MLLSWICISGLILNSFSGLTVGKDLLCSASERYVSVLPTELGYPTLMYREHNYSHSEVYNCSSGGHVAADEKVIECVSAGNTCPIRIENIQAALSVAHWPQYVEAFRSIVDAKLSSPGMPLKVNVFVLGGSMTHGQMTRCGCSCSSRFDRRCPKEPEEDTCSASSLCSWTHHVFNWLVEKHRWVQFSFLDFAGSGRMSKRSLDNWGAWLVNTKAQIGNNDIIFIDHSVNDAEQIGTHEDLSESFELLIRTLLHTYLQAGFAKPTIVVIEQYPHGTPRDGQRRIAPNAARVNDYAHTYRDVAKHYGTMLLSLREVFWTYFGLEGRDYSKEPEASKRLYPLSPYGPTHVETHPPWYIHLFMADVIAGSLVHTFHKLRSGLDEGKLLLARTNSTTIPKPFYALGNTSDLHASCDIQIPFALQARPNTTFHPANLSAYETDAVGAASGWRQYIDYHDTPGWIINDLSKEANRLLTFPLKNAKSYNGMIVKVTHLLSYEGMGMAQLMICGKLAMYYFNFDGLSNMFDKVSVPSTYVHSFDIVEDRNCQALPPAERTIAIHYLDYDARARAVRAKNHAKFKVLSAQVCTPAVMP